MSADPALAVVQSLRNGFFYGVKIRAVHAAVMTLLFKSDRPLGQMLNGIVDLTSIHARQLGSFALVYKGLMLVLEQAGVAVGQRALAAGAVGGYLVWGTKSPVAEQINMYLFSRILLASIKKLADNGTLPSETPVMSPFKWFGMIVWAVVMYQFETRQLVRAGEKKWPGMKSLHESMRYIYWDPHQAGGWEGGVEGKRLWLVALAVIALKSYRSGPGWFLGAYNPSTSADYKMGS
eukprot:Hpha_TRINITY_DN16869_c2_g6::TRINITY_DN16869_c2_g6_i1::g.153906::m.153906/K13350/PXMP4, PMP24; peroxisomal membrane protein 4